MTKDKKEVEHFVKGRRHYGSKKNCIICSGKAPGAIGEKTGGKW